MMPTDEQKLWEEKISRALKVKENWKGQFKVDLAIQFFEGQQNIFGYPEQDWVTINKVYSHLKAAIPSLYFNDPYFFVKVKKSYSVNPMDIALYEAMGDVRGSALNYQVGESKLKEKAKLAVQDAHFAFGVLKTQFKADLKDNPDYGKPLTGDDGGQMTGDDGSPLMEPERIPVNERYVWSRIHHDDFIFDEDAGPLEDSWTWVAHRVNTTLSEVRKDKRFKPAAVSSLARGNESSVFSKDYKDRERRKKGDELTEGSADDRPKDKPVTYWEVYHLKERKWFVIAEGATSLLVPKRDFPPGTDEHCFSILRFTLRDDSPYPIPPIGQGISPASEYNQSRSRILRHRKKFNRKYAILKNSVDPEEKSKLETGDDGTCIEVNVPNAIEPIRDANLDQMSYAELQFLLNDMTELLGGSTDESRGIAGAESATQASILDNRMEIRQSDEKSLVMDFITDAGRKMDMLLQANITEDYAVQVSGPEGKLWKLIRVTDYEKIRGEYEYSVSAGSAVPQLPQMERASFLAFLNVLVSFPLIMTSPKLMKKILEMHRVEDKALIMELMRIGQMAMQSGASGGAGSQPGVAENKPQSAVMGQQNGLRSMMMPGGGNFANL